MVRVHLLIVALLLSWGCSEELPEAEPLLRPVRYVEATRSGLETKRTLAGVVKAGVESRLSFRVGGIVRTLDARVGDIVTRGQVLATLDATDFELRVDEAKAAQAQAQAGMRRAEADYSRVRALYENRNAAKAELDAARAGSESAKAQLEAAEKRLELSNQQRGYTTLRSPVNGAIASVDVEVNENVPAGGEICLLVSRAEPEVAVAVPEVMIASVARGALVDVTLAALPDLTFQAEITEVGVAVIGSAPTYSVSARLLESDLGVRAGMAAEVTFRLGTAEFADQIIVPGVSVGEDREGRFVFVVSPESEGVGIVERRSVVVEPAGPGIAVLEGLEVGELVVTAGVRRLTDGMRVKLLSAKGPAG